MVTARVPQCRLSSLTIPVNGKGTSIQLWRNMSALNGRSQHQIMASILYSGDIQIYPQTPPLELTPTPILAQPQPKPQTRVALGSYSAMPCVSQRYPCALPTSHVFRWGYITQRHVIYFLKYHLVMQSSTLMVRAWPRWREPVTLGGGMHIMNLPLGLGSWRFLP